MIEIRDATRCFVAVLILFSAPVAVAKQFYCELTPKKYFTPRMNGLQFWISVDIDRKKIDKLGCSYFSRLNGENVRVKKEIVSQKDELTREELIPLLKSCNEVATSKIERAFDQVITGMEAQYRGNWGSSIFHFDTEEPVMITKFGLKPSGGNLRWYEAVHEFRGTYNHRRDQENEKIIGRLNNGVRLKLSFRASGPSQLSLSGAFGSLVSQGRCSLENIYSGTSD